jgi:hypothetical protein
MKIVSPFEYAIMQAVHEANPDKVTKHEIENTRAQTQDEIKAEREIRIRAFYSRIKVKPESKN